MNARSVLAILGLTCAASLRLSAQDSGAIERGESFRRQREMDQLLRDLRSDKPVEAPAISPDEAVDVGPQSILHTRDRSRWFELNLDSQFLWTDNMLYNESKPLPTVSSTVLVNSAQLNLTPPAWSVGDLKVKPRVGYQHVWLNYALVGQKNDPNSGLPKSDHDFDAQTVFGDLTTLVGPWQFQIGLDGQRLLSHQPVYSSYDEFYRDYSPRWSVSRIWMLGERHAVIAGYIGSYHFTRVEATPGLNDSDRNDRVEQNFLGNYSFQLTPRLLLQPGYRYQFSGYSRGHRLDQLHAFSGSLTVFITPWLFARGYGAYEIRESDDTSIPDYRKFDAGLALGATFRF
ncbi:MAG TPA: hypothetical protein DCM86_02345 [Verrucomicrobiales bacterium]|nr:hypothetical protein [Verrucomicrobiales bacterium]